MGLGVGPDIAARIAAAYGPAAEAQMLAFRGLLHVAALWTGAEAEAERQRWPAILIREGGPRSAADRFALELCRARADAIVVTGQILRDEPSLRYDRPGAGTRDAAALWVWRREVLGKAAPPRLVVLTRGDELDPCHPAFQSWARPLVFTAEDRAVAIRRAFAEHEHGERVEVVGHASPSLAAALAAARARGCETISLEAGPTTVGPLYRPDSLTEAELDGAPELDELMLSLFDGPLASAFCGPSFAELATIQRRFECVSRTRADGEDRWTLTRWRPRAGKTSRRC